MRKRNRLVISEARSNPFSILLCLGRVVEEAPVVQKAGR